MINETLTVEEWKRLSDNIAVGEYGCWQWTRKPSNSGYAQITMWGYPRTVHTLIYKFLKGPIPKGYDIDHLCRNKTCVNPAHMEVVTRRVNLLRGKTTTAKNIRKTHCPQGHVYTGVNIRGQRLCHICNRVKDKIRWAKKHKGI